MSKEEEEEEEKVRQSTVQVTSSRPRFVRNKRSKLPIRLHLSPPLLQPPPSRSLLLASSLVLHLLLPHLLLTLLHPSLLYSGTVEQQEEEEPLRSDSLRGAPQCLNLHRPLRLQQQQREKNMFWIRQLSQHSATVQNQCRDPFLNRVRRRFINHFEEVLLDLPTVQLLPKSILQLL